MKTFILFILFVFCTSLAFGQFGVSAKYNKHSNKNWLTASNEQVLKSSVEFGINYWFRLKNKRVEFLPEISYALASEELEFSEFPVDILKAKRTSLFFNFNTHIYPLDLDGDCNCPTFSKDGSLFKKGFYWILNPGIGYHNVNSTYNLRSSTDESVENGQIKARLGLGAGLDIGLVDILTISPFVMYTRDFGVLFPGVPFDRIEPSQADGILSNINSWQFGLRLMFRPDYVKSQG